MTLAEGSNGLTVEGEEISMCIWRDGEAEDGVKRVSGGCKCECRWQLLGDVLETILGVELVVAVERTVNLPYPLKLGSHFASHLSHLSLLLSHHFNEYISAKSGPHGYALLAEAHAERV